jgi:NSS family neurotransmitter:Na+ symporter
MTVGTRESWASRPAFVMAAVGSAVGLGNVWRFPYICYENGGGAFLIPYFVALFTAGIPLMMLEFSLGYKFATGAPQAMRSVSKNSEWIGWAALLCGFMVVTYYVVIMGWVVNYMIHSLSVKWGASAGDFFFQDFLKLPDSPGVLGGIRWPIFLGLVLNWVAIFFIIFKGVKAVSKVVMVTVPLPVLIIFIFVIRGLTLDGAVEGLNYYLTPQFSALLDPRVWLAAYVQIFFSLSLAFGVLIAYASYLPKRSDINNNAFLTSFMDCGISFLAGFAVFSTVGYLAQLQGVPIDQVVNQGIGLAFVTYPTIISNLPFAEVFGFLFFLMLLTLGIDSAFSLVEGVVAGAEGRWRISRGKLVFATCLVGFALGVVYTFGSGLYWIDIVDHFITYIGLPVVAIGECIAIGYLYKSGQLRRFFNSVSEFSVGRWWDFCILVLTPGVLGYACIYEIVNLIRTPYEGYPNWAIALGGWVLLVLLFLVAFVMMLRRREGDQNG